ncbi:MAG: APC family permease [Thermomicrobiales bacterium]
MPSSSRYRPPRRPAPYTDDDHQRNGAAADEPVDDLRDAEVGGEDALAQPARRTSTNLTSAPPDAVLPDSAHRRREREKRVRAPRKHGPRAQGDLVGKEGMQGRLPGDRYVRVHRVQTDDFQRAAPGYLVATEEALEARSGAGRVFGRIKRTLIGAPLTTAAAAHERLTKLKALAVLSSDALSSVAYATEEILHVLLLAGLGALSLSLPIGAAIVALLIIVGLSYRQTIKAYPNGGGSYIVAIDNLGVIPALTAGSALLFGYVVTVAVSIAAGVAALSSAVPSLRDHRVLIGLGFILLVTVLNLRGIRESGSIFAVPTYLFLFGIMVMLAIGMAQAAMQGFVPRPPTIGADELTNATQSVSILLILTAFSRGCAALTGVEAISDGVPAFKPPEWKNARTTLTWMIGILAVTFAGITFLANQFGIVPKEQDYPGGYETVVSQIARTVFGGTTIPYYYIQFATLAILILAANTAYSDFPRLAYFLARDKFLPKQYTFRGDRLAYSRGIITLGVLAGIMVVSFNAETTRMIPLYAVGVFTAFTLSQGGMVMRWLRLKEPGWQMGLAINIVGVITTGLVAVVVGFTNFTRGAWVVLVLIPLLIMLFRAINRHYTTAAGELAAQTPLKPEDIEHTVIVPISAINRVARQTLAYARSISPNVTAVFITDDEAEIEEMRQNWERINTEVPLVIIESPYRSIVGPLLSYLDEIERQRPEDTITVVLPEFIARHWWEQFLHNQTALRIKASLLFRPGIVVTSVPYHLERQPPPSVARDEAA